MELVQDNYDVIKYQDAGQGGFGDNMIKLDLPKAQR